VVQWARDGFAARFGWMFRLSAIWTLGWLTLLTLYADRRDRYSLPVYPGMAWMAGLWLAGAVAAVAACEAVSCGGAWDLSRRSGRLCLRWFRFGFRTVPIRSGRRSLRGCANRGIDRNESARPWAGRVRGGRKLPGCILSSGGGRGPRGIAGGIDWQARRADQR
jgi:hypothetical protein